MEVITTVETLTGVFHLAGNHFLIMRSKEGKMKPTQSSKMIAFKVVYAVQLFKYVFTLCFLQFLPPRSFTLTKQRTHAFYVGNKKSHIYIYLLTHDITKLELEVCEVFCLPHNHYFRILKLG